MSGYTWPPGKKAAAIVSLDFDGPSPYLWANREKQSTSLEELELRRFGPRQGIFRMMDLFDTLKLAVSVYVPGAVVDSQANTVMSLIEAGHEVGLHGYMHERVDQLNSDEMKSVLEKSVHAFERIGLKSPFGYRSPSWQLTEETLSVLEDFGVAYDSSLMGSDLPYWMSSLVEIPVQWPLDDAIFYRYVTGSNWPPVTPDQVIAGWKLELEGAKRYGSLFTLTVHPWLSGRSGRMLAFSEFLEEYRDDDEIWWATSMEIADYHRLNHRDDHREMPRLGEI